MSRYLLTQEQLVRLQDQIHQLTQINDTKQERIKELERRKDLEQNKAADTLQTTVDNMKAELEKLTEANEQLKNEKKAEDVQTAKLKELENLLVEERKLREASEALTHHLEQKCAEETLVRELTTELCNLQKAELKIESNRMKQMERKLQQFYRVLYGPDFSSYPAFMTQPTVQVKEWNNEHVVKNNEMKIITENLQNQLLVLFNEIKNNPVKTTEEIKRLKDLELWLRETNLLLEDINQIENLNASLSHLKSEIESRRQSTSR